MLHPPLASERERERKREREGGKREKEMKEKEREREYEVHYIQFGNNLMALFKFYCIKLGIHVYAQINH